MIIPRVKFSDQFSTFLAIVDRDQFIVKWLVDYRLKAHLNHLISLQEKESIEAEIFANQLLNNLRLNTDINIKHHLTSYLQEVCYWATKQIYNSLYHHLHSLTLHECFLWGSEAIIKPEKLLQKYQRNKGSKITTYAQTRLKTIIKDKVYFTRGWTVVSDWGLLKKVSKINREKILYHIGGLTGNTLQEYLLTWHCFAENYFSSPSVSSKKKTLYPPSPSQLKIMIDEYNSIVKNRLLPFSLLTVGELETRLKFCIEKARLFVNPITIEMPQDEDIKIDNTPESYLFSLAKNEEEREINQILKTTFNNLNGDYQAIFYLAEGFNFTQKQIINIITVTYPNFSKEQYQLSRNANKIRKILLDAVLKHLFGEKAIIPQDKRKYLIEFIQQWLTEYIEEEILYLWEKAYGQLSNSSQTLVKEMFLDSTNNKLSLTEETMVNLINLFQENFNHKLNLKLENHTLTNDHLMVWLEKFCNHYFYRIY